MTAEERPTALWHPEEPEPLPRIPSGEALAEMMGRAQVACFYSAPSSGGDKSSPPIRFMRYCEGLRAALPLRGAGHASIAADLQELLDAMEDSRYFVFARISTRRRRDGDTDRLLGVLAVAAAHPDYPGDGEMYWGSMD